MKKFTTIVFALVLAIVLTACTGVKEETTQTSRLTTESATKQTVAEKESENNKNNKILIAYFSYGENADLYADVDASSSASIQMLDGKITGNTGLVADYIAKATDGDVFSIITKEKYPSNYDDTVNVGQEEKNNNIKPEIANHIDNLNEYDTIFIGFPNWWYGMPMVMYSFFDEYDFGGKTIIPFCTSGGSAFSDSIDEMKKLEPDATVVENGFHVGASSASHAEQQVAIWISELNLSN
ncbi:MAG: flavodoxin [Eubacterium sp.]